MFCSEIDIKEMSSVFAIVDYSRYRKHRDMDEAIRSMWLSKMQDTISRNYDHRLSLEVYMMRETKPGGSLYDICLTYEKDKNMFMVLIDEFEHLRGFGGISEYCRNVYELNKICLSGNDIADDFLIKAMLRYYEDNIKGYKTEIELQVVVEKKNQRLLTLMKSNNFIQYNTSKNGVNVYMWYSPKKC